MRYALLLLSLSLCLREPRRSRYCPPSSSSFLPLFLFLRSNFQLGTALGKGRGGEGVFGVTLCVAPLWKGEGGFRLGRGREEKGEGGGLELHTLLLCLRGRKGATTFAVLHHGMQHSFWGGSSHTGKTALFVSEFTPLIPPLFTHPRQFARILHKSFFPFSFLGRR